MTRVKVSLARLKEGVGYRPDFSRGTFYIDRTTGDVEYLNDPDADVEREKGRDLMAIEPVTETEELSWMAEFAEMKRIAGRTEEWRQLVSALNGSNPVRQFNAVLALFPGMREGWGEERERKLEVAALRWLDSVGLGFEAE
ncbi:MAG TPA: hypothetical protein VI893_10060 [Thermoplasmata archaeon]|nr:hypothetical protein [Thermoplasmata archaeon]